MFNLKDFIKKGLVDAVGNMADYQVILNAVGWFEKGVLSEDDLAEIQNAIDAKNIVPEINLEEEITTEEIIE